MGKFTKISLAIGILFTLVFGVMAIIVIPGRSDIVWEVEGNTIDSNNTIQLTPGTYLFSNCYTFNFMSEGTMNIDLTVNNNDTSETYLISFSISPQSSNIETIYDVESVRVDGGTYVMNYSCTSPEFQSTSCKFRIIKPGAFRNMDNPVGTPLDDNERKWELYLQYSIIAAVVGGSGLLAALFSFTITRIKDKKKANDQMPQQRPLTPPPSSFSSSFPTEPTESTSDTDDDPYISMRSTKNKWVCPYCNTQNDDLDPYCIVCNSKREE